MNVVWIISDTFRWDHLGAYGNGGIRTPSLDHFAAKATQFNRNYAASFPTMPNRADLATGRWTMSYISWEPLPEGEVTLADLLIEKGIHTAAIVDTPFYLRRGMNYDRGFQTFFVIPGQEGTATRLVKNYHHESRDTRARWKSESDHNAPATFTKAMEWLELHYKEKFFLCIDTWDPHEPWDAPSYYTELYWPGYDGEIIQPLYGSWLDVTGFTEERVEKAHATYCGEVTMVDTWIGYFLRRLENMGLMDNTAIIFTSDHGMYFGEHGGLFGKMTLASSGSEGRRFALKEGALGWARSPLYEELIRCPLMIYVPGIPPQTYGGLTSAVDIMPTTLDLLAEDIPAHVEGQSLLPLMYGKQKFNREFVVSSMPFSNVGDRVGYVDNALRTLTAPLVVTITTGEWAFLYSPEPGASELYHLTSDPGQQQNVIGRHAEIAKELHGDLTDFMRRINTHKEFMEPREELRF